MRVGKLSSTAAPDEADGGQLRISRFLGEGGAATADALGGGGGARAVDASEIDESVLAELPLEVQREVRAEIAAARAPPPQPPRGRRQTPRRCAGAGRWAARGGARRRRAAAPLAAFIGNGGANGGGASGGASNPMAGVRSRGRTGPLAGGARSGGGGGGPTAVPRESHDDALSRLLAMGFGRAAGEAVLAAAGGDAQRAVEALLQ